MPKIETYEIDSSVSLLDILIGTDGDDNNETKNYRIGDILALFGQGSSPVFIEVPAGTVIKTILAAEWDGLGQFPSLTFVRVDTMSKIDLPYSFDAMPNPTTCIVNFGAALAFDIIIKLT